jgi:hypothetical protein
VNGGFRPRPASTITVAWPSRRRTRPWARSPTQMSPRRSVVIAPIWLRARSVGGSGRMPAAVTRAIPPEVATRRPSRGSWWSARIEALGNPSATRTGAWTSHYPIRPLLVATHNAPRHDRHRHAQRLLSLTVSIEYGFRRRLRPLCVPTQMLPSRSSTRGQIVGQHGPPW